MVSIACVEGERGLCHPSNTMVNEYNSLMKQNTYDANMQENDIDMVSEPLYA